MATLNTIDTKTIDELQELGKLTGQEKTIVSDGYTTKKLSIDTILGFITSKLNLSSGGVMPMSDYTPSVSSGSNGIVFIPDGEEIPVYQRTPGYFYLEEKRQTSIRSEISLPSSVTVSNNFGLRRV